MKAEGRHAAHVIGFSKRFNEHEVRECLCEAMLQFGDIVDVEPALSRRHLHRHAFVVFYTAESVTRAVEAGQVQIAGGVLIIEQEKRVVGRS